MSLKRFGYYYNVSTQGIPVGDNLLHPLRKIHSNHADFPLIDERYIYTGFLKFERDVAPSMLDRFEDYETEVKFEITPEELKDEVMNFGSLGGGEEVKETVTFTPTALEVVVNEEELAKEEVEEVKEIITEVIKAEEIEVIEEVDEAPKDATILESVEIVGDSPVVEEALKEEAKPAEEKPKTKKQNKSKK